LIELHYRVVLPPHFLQIDPTNHPPDPTTINLLTG
jgi:hypothetical protein